MIMTVVITIIVILFFVFIAFIYYKYYTEYIQKTRQSPPIIVELNEGWSSPSRISDPRTSCAAYTFPTIGNIPSNPNLQTNELDSLTPDEDSLCYSEDQIVAAKVSRKCVVDPIGTCRTFEGIVVPKGSVEIYYTNEASDCKLIKKCPGTLSLLSIRRSSSINQCITNVLTLTTCLLDDTNQHFRVISNSLIDNLKLLTTKQGTEMLDIDTETTMCGTVRGFNLKLSPTTQSGFHWLFIPSPSNLIPQMILYVTSTNMNTYRGIEDRNLLNTWLNQSNPLVLYNCNSTMMLIEYSDLVSVPVVGATANYYQYSIYPSIKNLPACGVAKTSTCLSLV